MKQQLHAKFTIVQRSKDQSSIASAAYAAGVALTEEETGHVYDYSRKGGVVHSEITLPDGPKPSWATNRSRLWNEVERAQRTNGQPARKGIVGLSHRLTDEARQRVARRWCQAICDRYRCASDWSIHRPDAQGDQRNDHLHVQFSTNVIGADGFAGKVSRDWDNIAAKRNGKEAEAVRWARELVCTLMNEELEEAGIDERWSHLTLAEQREEELRLAVEAKEAAEAALKAGDAIAAAEWHAKAENHARHADDLDREPTEKAGQASINRERQRFRLEHAEAIRLEAEARQGALAARDAGRLGEAAELERKAQSHADRAREVASRPTSELIKLDIDKYGDTPLNGSDRVEMQMRAPRRRNAERQRSKAREHAELLATQAAIVQVPTAADLQIVASEIAPMVSNEIVTLAAIRSRAKRAPKKKPATLTARNQRAPLRSAVRPWHPTRQALQTYKLRLLENAYQAGLSSELAQWLKYVETPKGEQLAQLRAQQGVGDGMPWLSITLSDGGRVNDQGDELLVRRQTRIAMLAMVKIAEAKCWERVEVFGEQPFRRDAWLEYTLAGIEAHGYEPTEDDNRELERLRKATEMTKEEVERCRIRDERNRALGEYSADDENHPAPKAPSD